MNSSLFSDREALSFVTETAEKIGFSGDIAVYERDEEIYHRAFGFRDEANRIPNGTTTRFGIASGTKLFTALGILKLVEGGVLSLDTRPSELFGEARLSFIDPEATIEQLLCHTSGIFDYYDADSIEDFDIYLAQIDWSKLETPRDYLELFVAREPKFAAGSAAAYSDGGYVFLGILIEMLTGRLFREFIEREVLEPLGMHRSGFFAFDQLPEDTAFGYIEEDGELRTNIYQLPIRGGGDGGMYSTAEDMHACWTNLFSGKLLSSDLLNLMTQKHSVIWGGVDYGLGLYVGEEASLPYYFITGSDAGVGFSSRYIPKNGVLINVLSNRTDRNVPVMKELVRRIGALISGAA